MGTINAAEVRKLLSYDPHTGVFTWRYRQAETKSQRTWNTRYAGQRAGSPFRKSGEADASYRQIRLCGKAHYEHRLAWLYMTGEWPQDRIDHKNGDGLNNSWDNLRESNSQQNRANSKLNANNSTGLKGVRSDRGKFRAYIKVDGQTIHLGMHSTPWAAHAAYASAATEHFGDYARPQ